MIKGEQKKMMNDNGERMNEKEKTMKDDEGGG